MTKIYGHDVGVMDVDAARCWVVEAQWRCDDSLQRFGQVPSYDYENLCMARQALQEALDAQGEGDRQQTETGK